jgi:hypothetical protein
MKIDATTLQNAYLHKLPKNKKLELSSKQLEEVKKTPNKRHHDRLSQIADPVKAAEPAAIQDQQIKELTNISNKAPEIEPVKPAKSPGKLDVII